MTRADEMDLRDFPDAALLDDAEVMLERAGMATGVEEIARYQRVAAVLRAVVAERRIMKDDQEPPA